jgi:hypothetical protein
MLDVARHAPRAMHGLDRGRSGPGPHRVQVGHKRRLRAHISAQLQPIPHTNPLVNADEMLAALTVLLARIATQRPVPGMTALNAVS